MDTIAVAVVDLRAGPALDFAVLRAIGWELSGDRLTKLGASVDLKLSVPLPSPSTDWAHGGPLIEKFTIRLRHHELIGGEQAWIAASSKELRGFSVAGATALEAICRFIVTGKFGDAVTIPRELVEVAK
jgi:hypothetical protein